MIIRNLFLQEIVFKVGGKRVLIMNIDFMMVLLHNADNTKWKKIKTKIKLVCA